MKAWLSGSPGSVYQAEGLLGKCRGPEVGAWHVPGMARRPVRQDSVWEEMGARGMEVQEAGL